MLSRLVLYDPQVLAAVIGYYNQALWPAQIAALLLSLFALVLALRPSGASGPPGRGLADRAIGGILAAAWAVTAIAWLGGHYAAINWAGAYYRWGFLAEAALLVWLLCVRRALRFGGPIDGPAAGGLALALFAILGHPVLELALGRSWSQLQLAGLMPGPTAVLTLALLAAARPRPAGGTLALLAAIPALWLLLDGVWAWLLGAPERMILPIVGLAALALPVWRALAGDRGAEGRKKIRLNQDS